MQEILEIRFCLSHRASLRWPKDDRRIRECNSDIKINSSPEMWPLSQEAEQSSSSLPRSESFSPLQTRLQRPQHLSTASESFLSTSRTGGQKVELSDSPKPRSSAAQQDKSSELLPTSSPSLPKSKLNQTLPGFKEHISTLLVEYHLFGLLNGILLLFSSPNKVQNLQILHPQGLDQFLLQ